MRWRGHDTLLRAGRHQAGPLLADSRRAAGSHHDPARSRKKTGLVLDLGRFVRPFITPDDVEQVAAILTGRSGVTVGEVQERGPLI